jgi:acyl-CoA hydrolase
MKSLERSLPAAAARAVAAVGRAASTPARRRGYGVFSAPRLPSTYVKMQEPFDLTRAGKKASKEITDPRQAFEEVLTDGSQVFIQSAAATPTPLVNAMCEVAKARNLTGINTMHILLAGPADGPLGSPDMAKHIRMVNFFIGPAHGARAAVNRGDADFIPVFLSEVPLLFRRGVRRVDVALINVSPPDKHGFCSLGVSVDCARSALQVAKVVIAMVNTHQPRTFGDGACPRAGVRADEGGNGWDVEGGARFGPHLASLAHARTHHAGAAGIHVSHLDYIWRHDKPLYTAGPRDKDGHADAAIGKIIAEHLVQDGATLQVRRGA